MDFLPKRLTFFSVSVSYHERLDLSFGRGLCRMRAVRRTTYRNASHTVGSEAMRRRRSKVFFARLTRITELKNDVYDTRLLSTLFTLTCAIKCWLSLIIELDLESLALEILFFLSTRGFI